MQIRNEKMLLSILVATFYFCFQVLLIFTIVHLDGDCLHSVWLNDETTITPFTATLSTVIPLMIFGTSIGIKRIAEQTNLFSNVAYYLSFFVVLSLWLNGLFGLWQTFEYEKGNLSPQEYYSSNPYALSYLEKYGVNTCGLDDN